MRYALLSVTSLSLCAALLASGCKKEDEQPPANTAGYTQPGQPGYQQPGAYQQPGTYQQSGTYQQQPPGAYQQPPGAYPQQPAATAQPVPAAPAASPQPNAIATACKSDAECIGAKCNLQAQKCQFPCGSNNDCQTGWMCAMGACVPSMNTTQQAH
jgi:hypothetical protein